MNKGLKDLTGKKFGKLLVVEMCPERGGARKQVMYNCICDCGNKKDKVYGNNLSARRVSSCGCLRKIAPNRLKDRKRALYKQLFQVCKRNGKMNGTGFTLSFKQWMALSLSNCFYCGCPPSNTRKDIGRRGHLVSEEVVFYNGIDRVDNKKGYFPENSVASCRKCNFAKGHANQNDFIIQVFKIYKHLKDTWKF